MIGYKLLKADGTSLNGQFHYPLDGTWVEVPGNGAYVADGFHNGLLSAGKSWDICVEVECEEPTDADAPERVHCYRRVRIRQILKDIMIIFEDGTREYYRNGKLHREDGPAIEGPNGYREWRVHGQRHREDGPAIEKSNGYRVWYRDDQLHREDGPAIERSNGSREWWRYGRRHREDGPAVEYADGCCEWWVDGVRQDPPIDLLEVTNH